MVSDLRLALASVDNKVDHILFVVEMGDIDNETVEFTRFFQHYVLRSEKAHNSALIVNHCWLVWFSSVDVAERVSVVKINNKSKK